MSLVTNISDLATAIATQIKQAKTWINGNAADLTGLTTTNKTNLVAAINEVASSVGSAAGIDDNATATTSTWSSSKTSSEIAASRDAILGGAGAAYDTLQELKTLIDASATDDELAALTTAVGNRVRFDAAQTLTDPQKAQARTNIDAASATDVGDTTTNFVTVFNNGLV
jgi:hypothetical protein